MSDARRAPRFSTPLKATALVLFAISLIVILRILVRPTLDPSNRTVVVVPFENLGNADDAFLADGVSEEIAEQLAQLPGVKVLGRDGIRGVTVATLRPREVAATLGAQYVLSGTVQWTHATGDSVDGNAPFTVVPELMEASVGERVWTQSFGQQLHTVAQVQSSIVTRVAEALSLSLTPAQQATLVRAEHISPAARVRQLRAHGLLRQGGLVNLWRADTLYRQAVAADSAYARAWAGLAETQLQLRALGDTSRSPSGLLAEATRASERAMALDSTSAMVRLTYARTLAAQFDVNAALRAVDQAIALDSTAASAWVLKSALLTALERLPEAGNAAAVAATSDRVSPAAHNMRAVVFLSSGAADSAVTSAERAVALAPGEPAWRRTLRVAYVVGGRVDDAVRQCEGSDAGWPCRVLYRALGGDSTTRGAAVAWLTSAPSGTMSSSERAVMYARLGAPEAAVAMLQQARDSRDAQALTTLAMPWARLLRDNGRWTALVQALRGDSAAAAGARQQP